jgi:hypothetical protein
LAVSKYSAVVAGYGFAATFHYAVLQLGRALKGRLAISFPGYFLYGSSLVCSLLSLCLLAPPFLSLCLHDSSLPL